MQVNLCVFFSELFNMCIVHGYVPNSCLNTTIVPICKKEHLLYAGESLCFFLNVLFNMCIVRNFVPSSCFNTTIVLICKKQEWEYD